MRRYLVLTLVGVDDSNAAVRFKSRCETLRIARFEQLHGGGVRQLWPLGIHVRFRNDAYFRWNTPIIPP